MRGGVELAALTATLGWCWEFLLFMDEVEGPRTAMSHEWTMGLLACVVSMLDGAPRVGYVHMEMGASRGVAGCISTCLLGFQRAIVGDIAGHTHTLYISFSFCAVCGYLARYTTDRRFCFVFLCFSFLSFGLFILYEGGKVSLAGYAWICFETVRSAGRMHGEKIDGTIAGHGTVGLGFFFV